MVEITKEVQFDYGHIVHLHSSKCKNPHGHRERVVAKLEGEVVREDVSEKGMVMDFKDVKEIMTKEIHDLLDHSFIISQEAPQLKYFEAMKDCYPDDPLRLVIVDFIPTAENLAVYCFSLIQNKIKDKYNTKLKLISLEFWETPTSCAIYSL